MSRLPELAVTTAVCHDHFCPTPPQNLAPAKKFAGWPPKLVLEIVFGFVVALAFVTVTLARDGLSRSVLP